MEEPTAKRGPSSSAAAGRFLGSSDNPEWSIALFAFALPAGPLQFTAVSSPPPDKPSFTQLQAFLRMIPPRWIARRHGPTHLKDASK